VAKAFQPTIVSVTSWNSETYSARKECTLHTRSQLRLSRVHDVAPLFIGLSRNMAGWYGYDVEFLRLALSHIETLISENPQNRQPSFREPLRIGREGPDVRLIGVIRMRMGGPAPAKQRLTNSHTYPTNTTSTSLYLIVVMLH
jgi:hypothetical protein